MKSDWRDRARKLLRRRAPGPQTPSSFRARDVDDTFSSELKALRDQVLRAIDGVNLRDLEDGLEIYGRLLRRVLDQRTELSIRLKTNPPATWFNEHGREADWLEADLRLFVKRMWRTPDDDVIEEFARQLVSVLDTLRRREQFSAFNRMLALATFSFYKSLEFKTRESAAAGLRALSAMRSYVAYELVGTSRSLDAVSLRYAVAVVDAFAEAARYALRDAPDRAFAVALELDSLCESLELVTRGEDLLGEGQAETAALARRLGAYAMGLLGYAYILRDKGLTASPLNAPIDRLRMLVNRVGVWRSVIEALEDGRAERYPWMHWEMQLWPPGKNGGSVGELQPFIRLAGVLELAVSGELGLGSRVLADWEPFAAQHFVASMANAARQRPSWFDEEVGHGVDVAPTIESLDTLAADFERAEKEDRARQPLVDEKVQQFMDALAREWQAPDRLRPGLAERLTAEPPSEWFGYNSLQPRDYFTDSIVHASPEQLGKSIGLGLVRGEQARVLGHLAALPATDATMDGLARAVDEALGQLSGFSKVEIFVVGDWRAMRALVGVEGYVTDRRSGTYRGVPVSLHYADRSPVVFVVDLQAAVHERRWMLAPADDTEVVFADGGLLVSLRAIDASYGSELLAGNPSLIKGPNGEVLEGADALAELAGLVHVRAWTKVVFEMADASAGIGIHIAGSEEVPASEDGVGDSAPR